MTESIVFKGSTGLNNRVDPLRHSYNPDNGIGELAEAVNCDIDETGMISRRCGQEKISNVSSHSLFCDDGDAFVVQDRETNSAIYQIGADFSLLGVRSGLVKGKRVSFAQTGDKTFYCNGTQNGMIASGISSAWPTNNYKGPDTLNNYSPAPIGTHVAYYLGRIWIAVENTIYCSEPFKPGLFRLSKCFFHFGSNVRMIRPVAGGVWVSDSESVGFIQRADTWEKQRYDRKVSYPAHEWSDNCQLVDLKLTAAKVPGLSAVWSSNAGLCIGTDDGQLINTTEEKLFYPAGASGATVVDKFNVINTVY